MTPQERYPALMAYIEDRSGREGAAKWNGFYEDKRAAEAGGFADVVGQLRQAQADYGKYPYNSAMGEFLGLPLRENHEPAVGYYMASQIMVYHAYGVAKREAERLIAEGRTLRVVAARSRTTRKPVRFHAFAGPEQIRIEPGHVAISNGKVKGTLSSNWSLETTMERLAAALRTGAAYGEPV